MAHVRIWMMTGVTLKELIEFVEECKSKEIPLDTPVSISQHKNRETFYHVVDMQADRENIIFYDYL